MSMDLKMAELLKEVQLPYSPAFSKLVDETISAIKDSIDKIPQDLQVSIFLFIQKSLFFFLTFDENWIDSGQVTADVAPGFVKDIGADKVDFKFKKPKVIEIGGSYSIQCIAKPDINVDLFLRLPKVFFHNLIERAFTHVFDNRNKTRNQNTLDEVNLGDKL